MQFALQQTMTAQWGAGGVEVSSTLSLASALDGSRWSTPYRAEWALTDHNVVSSDDVRVSWDYQPTHTCLAQW
jgi:hypothetical protein